MQHPTAPSGGPRLPGGFAPLHPGDPRVIGPFRVVGRIGAGGMGAVYGALGESGERVAVKVIHPRYAQDPGYRERFAREAGLLARVDAECAPAFLGADPQAETPWLATDFVPGRTLKEHVAEVGPLGGRALLSFAAGTAEALAAVHAAGVVHRDVKPANVMLSPTGPRVLDFGIARAAEDARPEERTYGTPGWVAPERLDGGPDSPRSDVFAWGGLVVYAATGRGPFGGGTADELLERARAGAPDLSGVPDELLPVVRAALDRDPARRPDAGEAMRAVLALAGEAEEAGAERDPRARLRALITDAWTGFTDAGRGAGPWVAAASVASLGAGGA
ncbi:serine/threonine-protein kinase, partial [Nocardiopsis composta]